MTAALTILAENKVGLGMGLIGEHGFCAHLEAGGRKILWDAGQGFCLPHNAPRLGVDLKKVDLIALSHGHFDHTGGLAHALAARGGGEVVCHPACFERKKARRNLFGRVVEVSIGMPASRSQLKELGGGFNFEEDSKELAPGVHFFTSIPMTNDYEEIEPGFFVDTPEGERPDTLPDDAALAVVTDKGVSVILGCAHRGIVNTLTHIQSRLACDGFYSVWGGTHMVDRTAEAVAAEIAALRELKVNMIATAHCTGFQNEMKLAEAFGERFAFACVGARAEL